MTYPDIDPLTEMVDLMGATRAYGLNVSAVQATKSIIGASLDILKYHDRAEAPIQERGDDSRTSCPSHPSTACRYSFRKSAAPLPHAQPWRTSSRP